MIFHCHGFADRHEGVNDLPVVAARSEVYHKRSQARLPLQAVEVAFLAAAALEALLGRSAVEAVHSVHPASVESPYRSQPLHAVVAPEVPPTAAYAALD